ncbi:MAG: C-terminal binding protein [Candidatus Latescibacterota bacterium]|nr:C-terminal binding protein [Candidatus Latescibacterota bacterium]
MAEFKVVVSDYILPDLEIEREMVEAIGGEFVVGQCKSAAELIELAHDADAMFNTYFGPIGDEVYAGCPKLKVVVRFGIGYDTIDVAAATRHGVMAVNVPDYCIEEVSDHAIGLWLALGRKIVAADRMVRTGAWGMQPLQPVLKLQGQTVGIVGLGRIGKQLARKLSAFGVELLFADPHVGADVDLGVEIRKVELEELCRLSDAITVHALANDETHHLLNAERFGQMDKCPIVVNTARARLIDTDALVAALEKGQIRGAGLDLVEGEELPADHPLMQLDNVVITPHVAWYSQASIVELRRKAAQEVVRVLQGEKPVNLLNPEVEPH